MKFQWSDYLEVARELEKSGSKLPPSDISVAMLRACIGRAYYASFHTAKQYLEKKKGYNLKKGGEYSHQEIFQILQKEENKKDIYVGDELELLWYARRSADYFIDYKRYDRKSKILIPVTQLQDLKNEARLSLKRSHGIIKDLNDLTEAKLSKTK